MAKNKKTPLRQSELDPTITDDIMDNEPDAWGKKTKTTKKKDETLLGEDKGLLESDLLKSDLYRDQVLGTDITTFGKGVQQVDTSNIDKRIAQIEKPTGGSIWEKQAAYYRQKGEGDVLRMQKDIAALTQPALTLWQERESAAKAKFEMLKKQMPEFDTTTIFGEGGPNKTPMPIIDEVKNLSKSIKADLRELSRLNINDPRYDELSKKVDKDQNIILDFNEINQKLLKIRNDVESRGATSDEWGKMSERYGRMWTDIYNSNGENIKIIDGKLMWVDTGKFSYDFNPEMTEATNQLMEDYKDAPTLSSTHERYEKISDEFSEKDKVYFIVEGSDGGLDGFNSLSEAGIHSRRHKTFTVDVGTEGDPNDLSNEELQKIALMGGAEKLSGFMGGIFKTKEEADEFLAKAKKAGFTNASIVDHEGKSMYAVLNGKKITIREGLRLVNTSPLGGGDYLLKEIGDKNLMYLDKKTTRKQMKSEDFKGGEIEKIQQALDDLGYDLGPEGVDGKYGGDTEAAIKLYLEDRENNSGKIKDLIIRNLPDLSISEEDKERYQVRGEGGEPIDLAKIGDEPILKSGKAANAAFGITDYLSKAIQAGANPNDPNDYMYKSALSGAAFLYDRLNVHEQNALLFDGMGGDDIRLVNTLEFIEGVLTENVTGYENMSTEERADALNDFIEKGITQLDLINPETNEKGSLRTMFKKWYLDKASGVATAYKPLKGEGGKGGGSGRGGATPSGSKIDFSKHGYIYTLGEKDEKGQYSPSSKRASGSHETYLGNKIMTGDVYFTYADMVEITGEEGDWTGDVKTFKRDYAFDTDNDVLYYKNYDDEEWQESVLNAGSDDPDYVTAYNRVVEEVNSTYGTDVTKETEFKWKDREYYMEQELGKHVSFDFQKIGDASATWSQAGDIKDMYGASGMNPGDHIFDFRDDDFVANVLNSEWQHLGFTFSNYGNDKVKVVFKYGEDGPYKSSTRIISTNMASPSNREAEEKRIIEWMKEVIEEDKDYWNQRYKYTKDNQYINPDGSIDF